jgi:hypothetical protein
VLGNGVAVRTGDDSWPPGCGFAEYDLSGCGAVERRVGVGDGTANEATGLNGAGVAVVLTGPGRETGVSAAL